MSDRRRLPRSWARRLRRRALGLSVAVGVVVLIVAYLWVLDLSRPHVDGDPLRFDTFVALVREGRIIDARILDEDSFVVGRYLPDDAAAPGPAGAPELGDEAAGMAGMSGAGLGSADVQRRPHQPGSGERLRPYNAALLRNTQSDLLRLLLANGVPITVDQQSAKRVASLAGVLLPGLIVTVLFVYLILSHRRGSGLFGVRSGARRVTAERGGATFADVAGQDAAVSELKEIRDFLADPDRFAELGARVPKGILLFGPPGCGKTLLAKALAGESGASFFSISGSDFVEVYVGVGASRVRDLFKEARENAPALVFIDELDSIGRARGAMGGGAVHGEQEHALNQVLAEMDGFSTSEGVIVIGATNRPDILDQALLRPGRFDRTIGLERPDEAARLAILTLHASHKRLDPAVDLASVANRAIGLTGADLESVLNEAALLAARASKAAVTQADLDAALQRILEAPERQRRLSQRQRSIGRRYSSGERVTFAEVAGVDDAIDELSDVQAYLANPERFTEMGARVPRGILLSGPPGCGKTLLARAVAGEANAAFISVSGSEFVEVFVGEGASRVRDLFAEARSVAPAIVFIDEIDAIGGHRSAVAVGGQGEREQTLNQMLVEMDGFDARTGVIVMGATNRPDMLDAALVRPGRFDRQVSVTYPDRAGRAAILALHAGRLRLGVDVDLEVVAGLTPGMSGADLANVLNEAALLATRRGLEVVPMALVEEGIDRALLGVASRGTLLSPAERRVVAFHEAGHALVAHMLPSAAPPHKLTIVPRGSALGRCTVLPAHERTMAMESELVDEMAVYLGGWAAERLVFGESGSGCSSDLHQVGEIARRMVRDFGMTEALGPLGYPDGRASPGATRGCSEDSARTIDAEVRRLVDLAAERARASLGGADAALDRVAEALIARETLTAAEFQELAGTSQANPPPLPVV